MDVSDRIKQQMKALELKSVHLVKMTGASKGSVSQWVNGISKPSGENLIALSKALSCSPDWLLTGKEAKAKPESNAQWLGDIDPWDSRTPLDSDEVELPFFKEVELAAGSGTFAVEEHFGMKLRFSKSTLRRQGVDPANAACVTVAGESMAPVLPDNSVIGVDTATKNIIEGKMYAIDHGGMLRVKALYRTPQGIRLVSYNPDKMQYPDETVQPADLKIIGKVFWYSVLI